MQLWQPSMEQLQQLQYQCIRPIMHLFHLPHGTNHLSVLIDSNSPSLHRYRQQLLLRYTHRLSRTATALNQLNPSLVAWNRDVADYVQYLNSGLNQLQPFCDSKLLPTALEVANIAHEWGVQQQLFNADNNSNNNSNNNQADIVQLLKQRMLELTLADSHAVPPRNAADPTPLRSILTHPSKQHYLHYECNPMTRTRARLRLNRAYTQINIDMYRKNKAPTAGHCTHGGCHQQPETVEHILLHCPRYSIDRDRLAFQFNTLSPKQPCTLATVLGSPLSLSPCIKREARDSFYSRFLSFSATFIQRIQSLREPCNLPAF
jgi:hypothetical protein